MANVFDIANFFIDVAIHNEEDCMTNLRLNKLLYFSQAWSLVKLNRPLFDNKIEAWDYGPVVPEVYHKYKTNKNINITEIDEDYSVENLSQEDFDLLLDIMREYGQYTTSRLVDFTHEAGSPWHVCVNRNSKEITNESMKNYFVTKKLKIFDNQINLEKNLIGYLGNDGIPFLPAGFDDDWTT